jgi:hypothetical protein
LNNEATHIPTLSPGPLKILYIEDDANSRLVERLLLWIDSEGQDAERLPGSRFHVMLPMNTLVRREAALAEKP